ncbi:hypothetical protein HYX13_04225 [Candidatus Woesearchaeota archaeon]|nr:hypothetical protein [Candidatus Woesearchaeota archaeon]
MVKLKTVLMVNILLFSLIGTAHLARLLWQWEISFAGWSVPLWLNAVFVVLAGALVLMNGKQMKG